MARDHARLSVDIWADPDFRALSCHAQRMYMLVLSQPDLTYCGSLTFTPRRWAALSPDGDVDAVEKAIHELEDARFLVVDWQLDELLVRSFVRNDGGLLDQPNMVVAVKKAAEGMVSLRLRQALAGDLNHHAATLRGCKGWAGIEGWVEANLAPSPGPFPNPSPNPSSKGSPNPSPKASAPPAPAPTPHQKPLVGVDADETDPLPSLEDFWVSYPRHHQNHQPGGGGSKADTRKRWDRLKPDEKRACLVAVARYRDDCESRNAFVKNAETWLNKRCWEDWAEAPPTPDEAEVIV